MLELNGRVSLITGAGNGLGKATVFKFAEEGAYVVIADANLEAATAVADEINTKYGESRALAVYVNVADRELVKAMVDQVITTYGKIDILINNAGITRDKTLLKMPEEWFDVVIDVNLKGVFNVTKYVVPYMVENGYGRIVNTSSVVRHGNRGQSNYSATKNAVASFTKTWAEELARKGIRVNAVAPGYMKTDMTAGMNQDALKATEAKIPMGHLGDPEDIAEAYLFLVSDRAKYITGEILNVNGGLVV